MADATEDDASKSWFKDQLQKLNEGKKIIYSLPWFQNSSSRQCDYHPRRGVHPPRAPHCHAGDLHQDVLLRLEAKIPDELGHEMRSEPAVNDVAARLANSRHHDERARDSAEHSGGAAEQFPRPKLTKYTSTGQSNSFHAKNAPAKWSNEAPKSSKSSKSTRHSSFIPWISAKVQFDTFIILWKRQTSIGFLPVQSRCFSHLKINSKD
jgi:hypothetical protein